MIAVARGDCPASLAGDASRGGKERERALEFFADMANHDRKFPFRAYKNEDVVDALKEMFGLKCAYCETYRGGPMEIAVEHYRPKGGVEGDDGAIRGPGYYWLAADWSNLLASCSICNSIRYHRYPDGRRKSGKGAKFPLVDESRRAQDPGEEVHEEPYLLDPCRDEPSEYLEFLDDGTIRAREVGETVSARGEKTIEILGLQRPSLSLERRGHATTVETALVHFWEAVDGLDRDPSDKTAQYRLRREIGELNRLMESGARFSAMARQKLEPALKAAGISP